MQIRVRCGCGESSCLEWAVVELLAGTKVTLKKPLLVLRKKKVSGLDHRSFGPAFC
jgi:ArsR family metal-binding transcriptional regulator